MRVPHSPDLYSSHALATSVNGPRGGMHALRFERGDQSWELTRDQLVRFSKKWQLKHSDGCEKFSFLKSKNNQKFLVDEELADQLRDYALHLKALQDRKQAKKDAAKKAFVKATKTALLTTTFLTEASLNMPKSTSSASPAFSNATSSVTRLASSNDLDWDALGATCEVKGPSAIETLDISMNLFNDNTLSRGPATHAEAQWIRDSHESFKNFYASNPGKFAQAGLTPYEAQLYYLATAHPESVWNTQRGNPLSSAQGTVHILRGTVRDILRHHPDVVRDHFGGVMPDPSVRTDDKIAPILWLLKVANDRKNWNATLDATARRMAGQGMRDGQGKVVPLSRLLAYAEQAKAKFSIYQSWVAGLGGAAALTMAEMTNPHKLSLSVLGYEAGASNPGLVRLNGHGRLLTVAETNRDLRDVRFSENNVMRKGFIGTDEIGRIVKSRTFMECAIPMNDDRVPRPALKMGS